VAGADDVQDGCSFGDLEPGHLGAGGHPGGELSVDGGDPPAYAGQGAFADTKPSGGERGRWDLVGLGVLPDCAALLPAFGDEKGCRAAPPQTERRYRLIPNRRTGGWVRTKLPMPCREMTSPSHRRAPMKAEIEVKNPRP
jgi:hypothetical protein